MADGSLIFDTKLDTSGLSAGLGKIGNVAGTAFKGLAVAAGAATTAVGLLGKSALEGYANYEQLTGGVETLFKTSSDVIKGYAADAYQTAGLSANQYMETVTSFSASLIQSLDKDTTRAAEVANMAVINMSDNANKMGSNIQDIQNAYQGFAKQNYTMLDNLKLGYGGTKAEMERLLADAEEISGIKYDISSFSDIAEAINVIQTNMGISGLTYEEAMAKVASGEMTLEEATEAMGTTAKEATTTIEGSVNSMKAAWGNLVVGLADDNANLDLLINQFINSVVVAGNNIIPRVEVILNGIGKLIETMAPQIIGMLPDLINNVLPQLIESGVSMVNSLITGITGNLGSLLELALDLVMQLTDVIISNLPLLIEAGLQVIVQLALGIAQALPELIPTIINTILLIVDTLIENVSMLVDAAIAIMVALAEGLMNALPQLIERVPEIIINLVNAIVENAPRLVEAGLNLIVTLAGALISGIPQLISEIPTIISALVTAFFNYMFKMNEVGRKVVDTIRDTIANVWSTITGKVGEWIDTLKNGFIQAVASFTSIGENIVDGIWNGISDGWSWLTDKIKELASGLLDAAKSALGIASPSKKFKYLGEMCVAGFDEGINDLFSGDEIARGVNASMKTISANTSANKPAVGGLNQTININREISTPDELARAVRLESKYGLITGVAF